MKIIHQTNFQYITIIHVSIQKTITYLLLHLNQSTKLLNKHTTYTTIQK